MEMKINKLFEKYEIALQNYKVADKNFVDVKNSSALGQGGRRFCSASDKWSKAFGKLDKMRDKLLKKYPQLKDLFNENKPFVVDLEEIKQEIKK